MELKDFFTGYVPFSNILAKSHYWKFVLNSDDKIVLDAMQHKIIMDKTFYPKGILVVNAMQETILDQIGNMSNSTLKRSLKRLNQLGCVIRLPKVHRNSRYFMGYLYKDGKNRAHLVYALTMMYDDKVRENINKQLTKIPKKSNKRPVINIDDYEFPKAYRDFIESNIDNTNNFLYGRLEEINKKLYTALFKDKSIYRKVPNSYLMDMAQIEPLRGSNRATTWLK